MTLTDFFTPCLKKQRFDALPGAFEFPVVRWCRRPAVFWGLVLVLAWLLAPASARAESALAELTSFELERSEDGVFVSAVVKLELPSVVEDVLRKGIPVYFVAEAELRRDRWYWTDKRVNVTTRHLRLVAPLATASGGQPDWQQWIGRGLEPKFRVLA